MNDNQDPRTVISGQWPRPGASRIAWTVLGLLVAVIVVVLLLGRESLAVPSAVSVRDILEQPEEYLDQRVIVSARVDDVLTHRALTLGSDTGKGSLLALVEPSALVDGYDLAGPLQVPHGQFFQKQDVVQLVGTVEKFDRDALAAEMDIVLNEQFFSAMQGAPTLLVDQLDVAGIQPAITAVIPAADSSAED
ncbi:MAG: hypothetical protein ACC726_03280 [Chloroflexota bacterium]